MRTTICLMAVAAGLLAAQVAVAQAPAGSTGQCKDGTYSTAASKQGACRGHQGVKEWYAADAPAAAKTATAATPATPAAAPAAAPRAATPAATPAAAPAASTKASTTTKAAKTVAAGGGPGLVWLNTSSKVYHCYGGEDYGTTKAGAYMSEADAKTKGAHADHGHACSR